MNTLKTPSLALIFALTTIVSFSQPANSPQEAGIEPVTGDLAPWRAYGADAGNFDQVYIIALNNGNIVAFKRGSDPQKPGVIGGTEFFMFAPDGTQINQLPTRGAFEPNGDPTPFVDYGATGLSWGSFTLGAHVDKANGTGFVVHNQGEAFQSANIHFGEVVGDEAFSLLQRFDNDGNPVGTGINAFGPLTAEPGEYRDIGALILSNGDLVSLGENWQQTDDFLDSIGAFATYATMAVILAPDGSTRFGPFAPHTDENGVYLGENSRSVFQNMAAFDGGFVIDYSAGIRWYDNDGTPRTAAQPDHAELADVDALPDLGFFIGANSGGRGDSMALASNGKDTVVKSLKVESGGDSIGALVYYNTDGTVRDWVRFDDVNLDEEIGRVDRTFCDMDENGNVFVVWEDNRFGEAEHAQIFGRFFDADGNPFGPSFPVYENWRPEPEFVDYGGSIGQVPAGEIEQPRCALNSQVGAVISASTLMLEIPDIVKQLSSGFDLVLSEAVVRIFKNPFADQTALNEWPIH